MTTINVSDIQQDLDGVLRRVEDGESLLVLRGDRPVAEIKPVSAVARQPRPFGLCVGQFAVPNDFDHALPEDILSEFEGR